MQNITVPLMKANNLFILINIEHKKSAPERRTHLLSPVCTIF